MVASIGSRVVQPINEIGHAQRGAHSTLIRHEPQSVRSGRMACAQPTPPDYEVEGHIGPEGRGGAGISQ